MKVQIIGASGTGKSTLAHSIGRRAGVNVIEADRYLWADEWFTVPHPVAERMQMYRDDTGDGADYVVAGSVFSWNRTGFADRDLLVLLRLDEDIRMERLRKRELSRYGAAAFRSDADGLPTNDFIEWCKTYLTADETAMNSLANHRLQIELAACPHLILDANQAVEALAEAVLAALAQQGHGLPATEKAGEHHAE